MRRALPVVLPVGLVLGLALGLVLAPAAACRRPHEPVRADEVEGPFTWGATSSVTHVRHLWLSGQPDEATLEAARAEGVGIVIDLREPDEHAWDEKQAVEDLGMAYHNVPVPREQPFPPDALARIDALVRENEDEQILVHCSTGNRAAGWLATHLVGVHGMGLEDALAVGRKAGITKDAIIERVASHVGEPAPVAAAAPEAGPGPRDR